MTYFVGIDGGGSKIEFAVSDHELHIVERFRIEQGVNPWHSGIDQTISLLHEGLNRLEKYRSETDGLVAGIAGCFNANQFRQPILNVLRSFCANADLVGDLPTGFRAVSNAKAGIVAIAGSGSSAVLFYSTGDHYLYDAVGNGGRDVGYTLAKAFERGQIAEPAKSFLADKAPSLTNGSLQRTADYYHSQEVRELPRHLAALQEDDPAFAAIKPWIDSAADRWRFKLYGMITKFGGVEKNLDTFPVVLNGGLWKFEYFRQQVVNPLRAEFPHVHIVFDPAAQPVIGALRMAKDLTE